MRRHPRRNFGSHRHLGRCRKVMSRRSPPLYAPQRTCVCGGNHRADAVSKHAVLILHSGSHAHIAHHCYAVRVSLALRLRSERFTANLRRRHDRRASAHHYDSSMEDLHLTVSLRSTWLMHFVPWLFGTMVVRHRFEATAMLKTKEVKISW